LCISPVREVYRVQGVPHVKIEVVLLEFNFGNEEFETNLQIPVKIKYKDRSKVIVSNLSELCIKNQE
jgi:hypothetical protein